MNGTVKRVMVGLAAVGLVAGLASVAFFGGQHVSAQGPGGAPERGGPGILGPMVLDRLDLSQDQHDRVKQILDSHRDEQRALRQRGWAAHEALHAAVTGDSFDEAAIRARASEVALVEADQAVARARVYAEVVQVLTPDQQSKLKTMQAKMKERGEKMRARRAERQAQRQR